ncbi:MAG: hypothetical protein IPM29_27395 [Planctomycetes bacterium]|nr:hypothetical protein [Planctomycetota bacterium]
MALLLPVMIIRASEFAETAASLSLVFGVVAVGAFYALGHLVQRVAETAVPSVFEVQDSGGARERQPSWMLMRKQSGRALSESSRKKLQLIARQRFNLDTKKDDQLTEFFLTARSYLIQKDRLTHADLFQAIYCMRRGLAVASLLGVFVLLGSLGAQAISWRSEWSAFDVMLSDRGAFAAGVLSIVVWLSGADFCRRTALRQGMWRRGLGFQRNLRHIFVKAWKRWLVHVGAFAFLLGMTQGGGDDINVVHALCMSSVSGSLLIAAALARNAQLSMTMHFASSVYRDLLADAVIEASGGAQEQGRATGGGDNDAA